MENSLVFETVFSEKPHHLVFQLRLRQMVENQEIRSSRICTAVVETTPPFSHIIYTQDSSEYTCICVRPIEIYKMKVL